MERLVWTALLVAVTMVWGWTFTVVRDAISGYGVWSFLAIRFAIASVALGWGARRLKRATWLVGIGIGFSLAIGYAFQTWGLRFTSPTNSGLITGLFVVFAPMADWTLFRTRPLPLQMVAVGVGLVGLLLLTGGNPEFFRVGDALTLGCALFFGLHIALLSRYAREHDPIALAFVQMVTATGLFAGFAVRMETFRPPSPEVWIALIITGVLASAFGFAVQSYVQQRLSALRTAIILMMEPVFAGAFGYLLAGDRLSRIQLLGAALVLSAFAGSELVPLRRRISA